MGFGYGFAAGFGAAMFLVGILESWVHGWSVELLVVVIIGMLLLIGGIAAELAKLE